MEEQVGEQEVEMMKRRETFTIQVAEQAGLPRCRLQVLYSLAGFLLAGDDTDAVGARY